MDDGQRQVGVVLEGVRVVDHSGYDPQEHKDVHIVERVVTELDSGSFPLDMVEEHQWVLQNQQETKKEKHAYAQIVGPIGDPAVAAEVAIPLHTIVKTFRLCLRIVRE